jgi:PAS domain S-box-containing protein
MPHPSHRSAMLRVFCLLAVLTLGLILAKPLSETESLSHFQSPLTVHTLLELASVIVAMLVFASGWNTDGRRLPRNVIVLACAFLGVALLDLSHALSYAGMPDYVTPNSVEKAIDFWLAARLLAAAALLWTAVVPPGPLPSRQARFGWLGGVLTFVVAVHAVVWFRAQWLPATFDSAQGLTTFKVGTEYAIVGMNLVALVALWRSRAERHAFHSAALFGAIGAMALSEGFFTLYARNNDFYILIGHLYKVVSYAFLYRAVFVEVVEEPFRELRSMRDELKAMLDAVPDVMIELDLQGRYLSVHSARRENLIRPVSELLGRTVFDVLPLSQAQLVVNALNEALLTGSSSGTQLELALPSGHRWFELSVARKGTATDPDEARFIMMSRDITERRRVEAAVLEQQAATQASMAKSEFLSRVSHELRTPLNAVIGFAQLLLQGPTSKLGAGQKLQVEYILRAGNHLLDMINDIMDLTRIESGDARLKVEAVNLQELVREALPMVATQAQAMGVTIHADGALAEHVMVMGDHKRLKQVLINILSNAIKYNRVGGQVTLNSRLSSGVVPALELLVTDTGKGLSPEQLKRLFEPFNRLGAEQNGIEGTGLGLVITRRLMEAMGGTIDLSSTQDVGTVVTLSLALAQTQLPERSQPQHGPVAQAGRGGERDAPCATVLCVEDNPLNAALLRAIFDLRPALRLLVAEDGRQALERVSRARPDIVLLDLNLPDMSGVELLQRLRQMPLVQDAVCIAMSADVLGDPIARAHQQGFADFWPKPLDVNTVLRRLDVVLASIDARQPSLWSASVDLDAAQQS